MSEIDTVTANNNILAQLSVGAMVSFIDSGERGRRQLYYDHFFSGPAQFPVSNRPSGWQPGGKYICIDRLFV